MKKIEEKIIKNVKVLFGLIFVLIYIFPIIYYFTVIQIVLAPLIYSLYQFIVSPPLAEVMIEDPVLLKIINTMVVLFVFFLFVSYFLLRVAVNFIYKLINKIKAESYKVAFIKLVFILLPIFIYLYLINKFSNNNIQFEGDKMKLLIIIIFIDVVCEIIYWIIKYLFLKIIKHGKNIK